MHLNREQKSAIVDVVAECGIPEVLRLLGTITVNEIEELGLAETLRMDIFRVAKQVQQALVEQASPVKHPAETTPRKSHD